MDNNDNNDEINQEYINYEKKILSNNNELKSLFNTTIKNTNVNNRTKFAEKMCNYVNELNKEEVSINNNTICSLHSIESCEKDYLCKIKNNQCTMKDIYKSPQRCITFFKDEIWKNNIKTSNMETNYKNLNETCNSYNSINCSKYDKEICDKRNDCIYENNTCKNNLDNKKTFNCVHITQNCKEEENNIVKEKNSNFNYMSKKDLKNNEINIEGFSNTDILSLNYDINTTNSSVHKFITPDEKSKFRFIPSKLIHVYNNLNSEITNQDELEKKI